MTFIRKLFTYMFILTLPVQQAYFHAQKKRPEASGANPMPPAAFEPLCRPNRPLRNPQASGSASR